MPTTLKTPSGLTAAEATKLSKTQQASVKAPLQGELISVSGRLGLKQGNTFNFLNTSSFQPKAGPTGVRDFGGQTINQLIAKGKTDLLNQLGNPNIREISSGDFNQQFFNRVGQQNKFIIKPGFSEQEISPEQFVTLAGGARTTSPQASVQATPSVQKPLFTSLVDIYTSRSDLQKAFPQGTVAGTEDNRKLNDWYNQHGVREYPNTTLVQPGDSRITAPQTIEEQQQSVQQPGRQEPIIEEEPPIIPDIPTGKSDVVVDSSSAVAKEKAEELAEEEEKAKVLSEEDSEIEKLERQKKIRNLREELGLDPDTGARLERPTVPTATDDFTALRSEQGVPVIESRINELTNQITELEDAVIAGVRDEEGRLAPIGLISARQLEIQRQQTEKLDSLNRSKSLLIDELNTKNTLISNLMNFKQLDYQNASNEYNTAFSQNLAILGLLAGEEAEEQRQEERAEDIDIRAGERKEDIAIRAGEREEDISRKDEEIARQQAQIKKNTASANLTTIVNMLNESNISWDDIDSGLQAQINKLEVQTGLPSGIIQAYGQANPDLELLATQTGTDAAGNGVVSFIYKDPETGLPGVVETVSTGTKKTVSDGGGGSSKDKFTFSATDKKRLISAGFTTPEISGMEKDLSGGADQNAILEGIDVDQQKTTLGNIFSGVTASQEIKQREEAERQKERTFTDNEIRKDIRTSITDGKSKDDIRSEIQRSNDLTEADKSRALDPILDEIWAETHKTIGQKIKGFFGF